MNNLKVVAIASAGLLLASTALVSPTKASPLDGLAGAAVGFALGAMAASPRPGYYAPRPRRVVVYRNRLARGHHAAGPSRRGAAADGAKISTASDPFAGSASAKPIPVSGR